MLSEPRKSVVAALGSVPGDILILGAGGKMGPSLARMIRRSSDAAGVKRHVVGISRFTNGETRRALELDGIETVACDLLDPDQLGSLPDAPNVIYMAAMKFGATGREPLTWAMNSFLPGMVCRKYQNSHIVAFSTGNIYGLTPVSRGGSLETDEPAPTGDYAMSCLGRERIFAYFSDTLGIPLVLLRLNYAVEMRYGVLRDIADRVNAGQPVDVSMGSFNAIWQADANAMAIQALALAQCPSRTLNITGTEVLSVRRVAERLAGLLGRQAAFTGVESEDALLSNASLAHQLLGYPGVPIEKMIEWIAGWVRRGGESLGKPTHFEARDGRF
jgi:nucleoside-diphosphate-sugar epimerase